MQKELLLTKTLLADSDLYEPRNKELLKKYMLSDANLHKELHETEEAWIEACEQRDQFNL